MYIGRFLNFSPFAIQQNLPYYYVSAAILRHQYCTLSYVLYSRSSAENLCHRTRGTGIFFKNT